MDKINDTPVNAMKVSEEVIASVVRFAVADVDGVASLCGKRAKASDQKGAIRLNLSAEFPEVTVKVLLTPNCKADTVCRNIQKRVIDDVLSMTGIALSKVNVILSGIMQTAAV